MMEIKLFCLQRYTRFLTHLMRAITGVAEGKKYNWCAFVRNRMQTLLKKVAKAPRQASFFLPTIFTDLLFYQFHKAQLPTPQELPNTPKLLTWTEVYGQGIILEENVDIMIMQLQKIVEIVTARIEGDIDKLEEILATTSPHGQRTELQQVEDAEDRRRKKGKYKAEEDAPRTTPEEPPQPSTKHASTSGVHQVPIPSLPDYLTNRLRLEWPGSIPDNFVHLEYDDRWKVFEEGLDKEECELFNHEQWRPTFTANVINILVRDLVRKIKDPEYSVSSETKRAQEQAFEAEQKIKFIERFCDTWLEDILPNDTAYQQFKRNYSRKISKGLESLIPKLGTWILKHDRAHKEIYELKSKMADAIRLAKKAGKEADDAHK
eukprot:Gb_13797 [translate_table: standard]